MYENVTYEEILERMLDRVDDKFDKREGAVIFDTHSPTAIELQILYIELDTILREAYGDTASREFLILRCQERGISPYPATNAVLKGVFTPSTVDVLGKRFNIGTLNYVVTEKISDGEYQVQCETAGIIGNQYLSTMIPIEYIEGLETATLTEVLIPGEDEEDTEVLRQRYFASFEEKAFGGNRADYITKTNAIPGVGSTKVTRVWNGDISPASMIPNGTVQSWYEASLSSLPADVQSWITAVYTAAKDLKLTTGGTVLITILDSNFNVANETLIGVVKETLDPDEYTGEGYGIAPIGHVVNVKSAEVIEITVRTTITFDTGYSWSNLQTSIDNVISDYLLELRQAWADQDHLVVRISQIETRLLSLTGVIDIYGTTINNISDNLTLGKFEVPIFKGASA
mgnify:CR=1 FL=1